MGRWKQGGGGDTAELSTCLAQAQDVVLALRMRRQEDGGVGEARTKRKGQKLLEKWTEKSLPPPYSHCSQCE